MEEINHILGKHTEAIETLKGDMRDVKILLLDIKSTVDKTRGGAKVLIAVGSAAGALGGALSHMLIKLKGGG